MDDEKFRRFEHVVNLYIYYVARKLEWARKQLDRSSARSQVLNETVDEIADRLEELDIAVAAARETRSAELAAGKTIAVAEDARETLARARADRSLPGLRRGG